MLYKVAPQSILSTLVFVLECSNVHSNILLRILPQFFWNTIDIIAYDLNLRVSNKFGIRLNSFFYVLKHFSAILVIANDCNLQIKSIANGISWKSFIPANLRPIDKEAFAVNENSKISTFNQLILMKGDIFKIFL
jgi:hypothetical protein